MLKQVIAKDNALINASYYLSLVEQRLLLLGIVQARNNQNLDNKEFIINVSSYINAFNVDDATAYLSIKDACRRLKKREFTFTRIVNGVSEVVESHWVQSVAYATNSSYVKIRFTDHVLPLITNLEKHFTSYQLEQVKNLTSIYAIRLYELLISWKQTNKLEISLADLRLRLGIADDEYLRMNNFKARVLDIAIQQIDDNSDLSVKYEQIKQGRAIVGFKFTFKQKEKQSKTKELNRDNSTVDLFSGLTDKQLERIARNKLFIADYNHLISANSTANKNENEWVRVMVEKMKKDISVFNKKPLINYLN